MHASEFTPSPPLPGEHIDQFEIFETRRFVSRLLGRGDVGGLMDKIQDVIPEVCLLFCVCFVCLRLCCVLCVWGG